MGLIQKWGKMKEDQYVLFTPQSARKKFVKINAGGILTSKLISPSGS